MAGRCNETTGKQNKQRRIILYISTRLAVTKVITFLTSKISLKMDGKHRLASFILDSTIGTETVATSRGGAGAQPARINDPRRNDGDELAFVMHLFNLWGEKNMRFNYSGQNCPINFAHEREIYERAWLIVTDIFKHGKYGKLGSA